MLNLTKLCLVVRALENFVMKILRVVEKVVGIGLLGLLAAIVLHIVLHVHIYKHIIKQIILSAIIFLSVRYYFSRLYSRQKLSVLDQQEQSETDPKIINGFRILISSLAALMTWIFVILIASLMVPA